MQAHVDVEVIQDGASWLVKVAGVTLPDTTVGGANEEEALENALAYCRKHVRIARISSPTSRN